ncbi:glucan endo-1,3-beta-glucosidase 14 [Iris pallida]|uniref:Glucan endo-1,3-beta-glucosidase 14 n=1 Tax=Iris pallida TaxID=29817 RepID=A0AAX6DME8_IRIPA|nr:glucan endo-1,3-beta-glucosidase 14 [Iris pallida]
MEVVVDSLSLRFLLLFLLLSGEVLPGLGVTVGINYGQIANNLPSPTRVASLLQSLSISRVKLYDADQNVLSAFINSNVEFIVGIGNEHVAAMTDPVNAQAWIQQHVQPYVPSTRITCITVGNEVISGNDTLLKSNLLPAMQSVYQALLSLGLDKQINVTTPHSLDVLGNSFPPSAGSFRQEYAEYIQPLLSFLSSANSPSSSMPTPTLLTNRTRALCRWTMFSSGLIRESLIRTPTSTMTTCSTRR